MSPVKDRGVYSSRKSRIAGASSAAPVRETRVLRAFNLARTTNTRSFGDLCKRFGQVLLIHDSKIESLGYAYVGYYDLRDAMRAFKGLDRYFGIQPIRVEYVPEEDIQRLSLNKGLEEIKYCLQSAVLVSGGNRKLPATSNLNKAASRYGDVKSIELDVESYIVEFFDIRSATKFASVGELRCKNTVFKTALNVHAHDISNFCDSNSSSGASSSNNTNRTRTSSSTAATSIATTMEEELLEQPKTVQNTLLKSSLTDSSYSIEENLKNGSLDYDYKTPNNTKKKNKKKNESSFGIVTRADVPKNNVVDLKRIAKGLDTRTTLMLRNIPNKVDQHMLKEYIDVTNANTYDFLCIYTSTAPTRLILTLFFKIYELILQTNAMLDTLSSHLSLQNISLPSLKHVWAPNGIDSILKRSVTYLMPIYMYNLCMFQVLTPISRGTQGKECLIEKFRNSSVMDQNPAYQPRVYYSEGDKQGQEQEFPPPNNINRKLRSIVSVQRIGLFPPHDARPPNWKK